jgi:hypothetical protein
MSPVERPDVPLAQIVQRDAFGTPMGKWHGYMCRHTTESPREANSDGGLRTQP